MNKVRRNSVRKRNTGMESDNWDWNVGGRDHEGGILMDEFSGDGANVRLLGGDRSQSSRPIELRRNGNSELIKEERKYKYSLVSVLIIGVCLIMIINIGLGYRKCDGEVNHVENHNTPHTEVKYCFDKATKTLFPWQKYRLPNYIKPTSYNLFLHPNLTTHSVFGSVNISLTANEDSNFIILHSRGQTITRAELNEKKSQPRVVQRMLFCADNEMISLDFGSKLIKGKRYHLFVKFSGNITFSLDGFYLSRYREPSGSEVVIGATQFESVDARAAFPCFDEPDFKAEFKLSIVRTTDYHTLSNMPFTTANYDEFLKIDRFEPTVTMSTYLLAFLISDFQNITGKTKSNVEVSIYAPPDKTSQCHFALEVAINVLSYYENLFQIPFPLPKLDLAAIPDFAAGAMENWGLVTYRETSLLFDPALSSLFDEEWVAMVIAHELAHQWFGNLVTMRWWNDLWLNEGFASYMEYLGVARIKPEWDFMSLFALDHMQTAMSTDASRYTHPISVAVDSKEQIEEMFDSISYDKGACIISMLANYIGHEDFQTGVNNYLNTHKYSNAVNQDLISAVSNASGVQGIQVMMNTWTSQPGFPIVDVTMVNNQVKLKQSRFLYQIKDSDETNTSPTWQIPLLYVTNLSPYKPTKFFMNKSTATFTLNQPGIKWIKFNHNQTGYYKVNYDDILWKSLISQMKTNHRVFTISDRVSLLSDAFSAGAISNLHYENVFNLVSYLKKETSYAPVTIALQRLIAIKNIIRFQFDDDLVKILKSFIVDLIMPLYNELAWKNKAQLSRDQAKLQTQVVSVVCRYGHKQCLNEAMSRFGKWKQNSSSLNSDEAATVLGAASEFGSSEDWGRMWGRFLNSTDANEKRKLLRAVTLSRDFEKMNFLLNEVISGENIKAQDQSSVISGLTTHVIGSPLTWRFVKQHWAQITKSNPVGQFAMRSIVHNCMAHVMEESEIAGAKSFFESKGISEYKYIKQSIETAQINLYWVQTNYEDIKQYFDENKHNWPAIN